MNNNNKSILLALAAVLSWSTVATAFKVALTYLTHFEMLLVASVTSLAIFATVLTVQRRWADGIIGVSVYGILDTSGRQADSNGQDR